MTKPFTDYTVVNYRDIEYDDLENFINKHYKFEHSFEIPCDQEAGNGSNINISVKKEKFRKYDLQELKEFNGSNKSFMLQTILTDLANKDLIEEGEYLISISW